TVAPRVHASDHSAMTDPKRHDNGKHISNQGFQEAFRAAVRTMRGFPPPQPSARYQKSRQQACQTASSATVVSFHASLIGGARWGEGGGGGGQGGGGGGGGPGWDWEGGKALLMRDRGALRAVDGTSLPESAAACERFERRAIERAPRVHTWKALKVNCGPA